MYIGLAKLLTAAELAGPLEAQVSVLLTETETRNRNREERDLLSEGTLKLKSSSDLYRDRPDQDAISFLSYFFFLGDESGAGVRLLSCNYLSPRGLTGVCGAEEG